VGWWNTGCYAIHNNTSELLFVVPGFHLQPTLEIPANSIRSYLGYIFPWCQSSDEIAGYALRFLGPADPATGIRPGRFYMFQDTPIKIVSWVPWPAPNQRPSYDARRQAGAGMVSAVDVIVSAQGTPRTVGLW